MAEFDRNQMRQAILESRKIHESQLPIVGNVWKQLWKAFSNNEFSFDDLLAMGVPAEDAEYALQTLLDQELIKVAGLRRFKSTHHKFEDLRYDREQIRTDEPYHDLMEELSSRRCILCGNTMQKEGFQAICMQGHPKIQYSALLKGGYSTKSKKAARLCEQMGHSYIFRGDYYDIELNPNAPPPLIKSEVRAWRVEKRHGTQFSNATIQNEIRSGNLILQKATDHPYEIDPAALTHGIIITSPYLKDKLEDLPTHMAQFHSRFQPLLWNEIQELNSLRVKNICIAVDDIEDGYPNIKKAIEKLSKAGVTDANSIVLSEAVFFCDEDGTHQKAYVGFAFRDIDPKIILAYENSCIPAAIDYKRKFTFNKAHYRAMLTLISVPTLFCTLLTVLMQISFSRMFLVLKVEWIITVIVVLLYPFLFVQLKRMRNSFLIIDHQKIDFFQKIQIKWENIKEIHMLDRGNYEVIKLIYKKDNGINGVKFINGKEIENYFYIKRMILSIWQGPIHAQSTKQQT